MKKVLLYLCLAAGLLSCVKEKEIATIVDDNPEGVPVTFNIKVSDDPETRASKTAWAENDEIYVFFYGVRQKYLKLTYNGSGWDSSSEGDSALLDTDFADLSKLELTAVHFPVPVDMYYNFARFVFSKDGKPVYHYYLFETNKAYTVEGATVTVNLSLGKPDGVTQFHIAGIQGHASDYLLRCDLVKPTAFETMWYDGIINYKVQDAGSIMRGFADADGAVFSGQLTTTEAADYVFTLEGRGKIYTLTRTGRALAAGKMYNFPALDSGQWTVSNVQTLEPYIDLGLPSGTLWATTNLGASKPEEYGGYFAWGETSPKTSYTLDNYAFWNGSEFTKYNGSDFSVLRPKDDAARAILGDDWRIPTIEEWREVLDNCTIDRIIWNEIEGHRVTGPNGNSIFLPNAGEYVESTNNYIGHHGAYWSSFHDGDVYHDASAILYLGNPIKESVGIRYQGQSIRPVYAPATYEYVDFGLPSGTLWATTNIGATSPEDYGDYFAWGETDPKTSYSLSNYQFWDGNAFTKYTGSDFPFLQAEDDAARVNWGGDWRTPTEAEWQELRDNCYLLFTEDYNRLPFTDKYQKFGIVVLSKDYTKKIFLPANGMYNSRTGSLDVTGVRGYYWSSTFGTNPDSAFLMYYVEGTATMAEGITQALPFFALGNRPSGMAVRPVKGGTDPVQTGSINGHAFVNMGNGLKWATMNVGASSPEKSGGFYCWGETETKSYLDWNTYKWIEEGYSDWKHINKYTVADGRTDGVWYDSNGSFIGDGKTSFEDYGYADDPARQNWGSSWRTPTQEEWTWLQENCTWTFTLYYQGTGTGGMIVTSNVPGYENNSIFLPAVGLWAMDHVNSNRTEGYYWSNSLAGDSLLGNCLYFRMDGASFHSGDRRWGYPVRAVSD